MPQPLSTDTTTPWKERLLCLVPALAALILFLPVLGNGFVNWDDPAYVYENLHIRSLDLKWIFTAIVASNYHPLTLLSHTLDFSLFGLNPAGHHFTSIILHALNSGLVFIVARRIFDGDNKRGFSPPLSALLAALLFAVHPLHVESVAWVSERKDVLAAFFFLIALLTYLKYTVSTRKRPLYCLTLFFFLLALLSKPMAVTLPVVLLILDYYPLKRDTAGWGRIIIEKIPFFALSAASAILTLWAQKTGGAVTLMTSYPLQTRLLVAVKGYIFYLYKLVLPVTLAPYYPLPLNSGLADPVFLLSLALFVFISLFCLVFALRGRRALSALWLYYVVTLLPVVGLVQVGSQAAADRYAYLPTAGFFLLAATAVGYLYTKRGSAKTLAMAVTIIAMALLVVKTTTTIPIWKDSITLWSHEIDFLSTQRKDDRLAATIALYNRAKAYDLQARSKEAIEDYGKVITINPAYIEAYINRGVIYGKTNRYREAIRDFSLALQIDPNSAAARYNRGLAYEALGEREKVDRDFTLSNPRGARGNGGLVNP